MAQYDLGLSVQGSISTFASKSEKAVNGLLTYHYVRFYRDNKIIAESGGCLSRTQARNQAVTRLAAYLRKSLPVA